MHRGTTGEVDCLELVGNPAALLRSGTIEGEHPVRHREVDDGDPQAREQQPRSKLQAVGDRTGDEGDGDDREHELKRHEHRGRESPDQGDVDHLGGLDAVGRVGHHSLGGVATDESLESEELRRVAEQARDVVPEGHRVPVQHPQDRHQAHGADTHHDHVEHVLRADHAAVEEGQTGCHQ